jgi:hypothetical protein
VGDDEVEGSVLDSVREQWLWVWRRTSRRLGWRELLRLALPAAELRDEGNLSAKKPSCCEELKTSVEFEGSTSLLVSWSFAVLRNLLVAGV